MPTTSALALVPTLPDVLNKRVRHAITDLQPGDNLHPTAALLGFPKGLRLPVYGFVTHYDQQTGQPFLVRAYVRPLGQGEHVVGFLDRDAARYPTPGQKEQWFGACLLYLVEIDLTEYADCLRLERQPAAVSVLLAPVTEIRLVA